MDGGILFMSLFNSFCRSTTMAQATYSGLTCVCVCFNLNGHGFFHTTGVGWSSLEHGKREMVKLRDGRQREMYKTTVPQRHPSNECA